MVWVVVKNYFSVVVVIDLFGYYGVFVVLCVGGFIFVECKRLVLLVF